MLCFHVKYTLIQHKKLPVMAIVLSLQFDKDSFLLDGLRFEKLNHDYFWVWFC